VAVFVPEPELRLVGGALAAGDAVVGAVGAGAIVGVDQPLPGADVRLDRGVTAFIRVNNLADTEYDAVIRYPGMPRTVMAGARFSVGK
jgi:outer membrane receptor protein involved in Fe transport